MFQVQTISRKGPALYAGNPQRLYARPLNHVGFRVKI